MNTGVYYALLASLFFGASTPVAKLLLATQSPLLVAGLLYLGSGVGLAMARVLRDGGWKKITLTLSEWPWLLSAVFFGGILAPVFLLYGLMHVNAATASLLLNLEAVLTAVIAWCVFKENTDKRIVLGMLLIVIGCVLLAWPQRALNFVDWLGPLAVVIACLCWAVDNNLTRKVSATDALFVAGSKGIIAGVVNTGLAMALGVEMPNALVTSAIMLLGLFGYGISLVFFVLSLRSLGAARTGAYFSTAPFIGAAVALFLLHEAVSPLFTLASVFMAVGVWLHLTERHAHQHTHAELEHIHLHSHDAHHQHEHDEHWNGREPHSHFHKHTALSHTHVHFPDIHHQHVHSK
ncbi:EamA family transporter [Methylomonas sp. AM2-LC]|uniref:DMT family transporter n=1 Tax=Methylomonas sp. AM2-LC TaxID=3153301 RepID=UPI0032673151